MCRSCVLALIRLEKLEKNVELNLVDAVEVIVQQPRKRICTESSRLAVEVRRLLHCHLQAVVLIKKQNLLM